MISKAKGDPNLEERADVLSIMMRARYDDGSAMTNRELIRKLRPLSE